MYTFKKDNLIKQDSSFHIFFSNQKYPAPIHTHDFIEIVYISGGSARQEVNGTEFDTSRGDLVFINRNSTHAFVPKGDYSYYNICFSPEAAEGAALPENAFSMLQLTVFETLRQGKESGIVTFSGTERDEIENLFASMCIEYKKENDFKRAVLESYISILLVKILRKTLSPNKQKSEWRSLAEYIDENLASDLSLSTLSQRYFYNSSYFSRAFKKQFGMSLTEYIGSRRIAFAAKLLRETHLTVSEIAQKVGYSSKSSFYRAFTKTTGKSPSDYRE